MSEEREYFFKLTALNPREGVPLTSYSNIFWHSFSILDHCSSSETLLVTNNLFCGIWKFILEGVAFPCEGSKNKYKNNVKDEIQREVIRKRILRCPLRSI